MAAPTGGPTSERPKEVQRPEATVGFGQSMLVWSHNSWDGDLRGWWLDDASGPRVLQQAGPRSATRYVWPLAGVSVWVAADRHRVRRQAPGHASDQGGKRAGDLLHRDFTAEAAVEARRCVERSRRLPVRGPPDDGQEGEGGRATPTPLAARCYSRSPLSEARPQRRSSSRRGPTRSSTRCQTAWPETRGACSQGVVL